MSGHFTPWDPLADPDAEARGFNPPRTRRLWRDLLLPRIVLPLFWCYWLVLLPAGLRRGSPRASNRHVALESGRVGWTHVFFEELWDSAGEYLGAGAIERITVDRDTPYLPQFRSWVRRGPLSHAVIDPRTGAQTWPRALLDVLVMSWTLRRRRVTPVVILTDASLRRHRLQAAVLTAHSGVVVTYMSAELVAPMFPHRRIIGPLPMPVSVARLEWLEEVRAQVPADATTTVSFIGGMYAPRSFFLERLGARLADRGIALDVHANKYETSNDEYWRVLATSDVIVTTTMQGMPRRDLDWIWIQQLVFRFSEALSAGAVLASPEVVGADRFFTPQADFAPFASVDGAVDALARLVEEEDVREGMRARGHATAAALARDHAFWAAIDHALGERAMRRPG